MKKVIKPLQKEEAVYYSDFNGKCFGKFHPEATLSLQFDYGSKYDGSAITLHLSDEEANLILKFVRSNMSDDYKNSIKAKLEKQNNDLNDAIDARDYSQCDYYSSSCDLLQFLLE